jgi:DNA-binding transcriptional MerR regulator
VSTSAVGRTADAAGDLLSIGDVLARLQPDFPDVTISKIRFLEAEGLVEPARTSSGYRKFTRADVERLRYVLTMQRDHYLPLKVIRDYLDAIDRGLEPPELAVGAPRVPRALVSAGVDEGTARASAELRLSRAELCEGSGLAESLLEQVEAYGLVSSRQGYYDADALAVARTIAAMAAFGLEPRHLRPFRLAADREVALVQQVVGPAGRGRSAQAQQRADESARELASLAVKLHAALVRHGLSERSPR